ncbi:hypothetical protein G7085_12425 [Tessaracoccus sp. HDW20]|uniref:hypothetical protein n=1 Tax=Tessaracoccus coleopterorum TaxID=2714950 RepID=UPI0018D3EC5A|nr:hypothetical protein [Tessaracoccus coleopterorum]NHB85151.1 hypothetical protein [Tessaracoccus coleopterorum]
MADNNDDQRDRLLAHALREAEEAAARLAEAGGTIEELRRDAIALATRMDLTRADTEKAVTELDRLHAQVSGLQTELMALRAEREVDRTNLEEAAHVRADLEAKVRTQAERLERDPLRRVAKVIRRK